MYNFDKQLVSDILDQCLDAIYKIKEKCSTVHSPEFFYISTAGEEKLDSIRIKLIAIGESFKNIDRITNGKLLINYPEIEWKK